MTNIELRFLFFLFVSINNWIKKSINKAFYKFVWTKNEYRSLWYCKTPVLMLDKDYKPWHKIWNWFEKIVDNIIE